jgi:hypothetical protein
VARKLFADPSLGDRRYPPLAAWRSWLMAAWAVIVVAAYFTAQWGGCMSAFAPFGCDIRGLGSTGEGAAGALTEVADQTLVVA